MPKPPTKVNVVNKSSLNDDHDQSDTGHQRAVRDGRGQEHPTDKKRPQQSTGTPEVSQSGQSSGYSSSEKKRNVVMPHENKPEKPPGPTLSQFRANSFRPTSVWI